MKSISERFWEKVQPEPNSGCWIWTAGTMGGKHGSYGQFRARSGRKHRSAYAHRVAYELVKGEIPRGMVIDHLCKTMLCCNPDHLEAVTQKENVLRSEGPTTINKKKTHCIRGHEFTEANTYRAQKGKRACVTCRNKISLARSYKQNT